MTAARFYSSIAPQMILQGSITGANTTFTVDTVAGLPGTFPFTLVLDPGVAGEEIVNVTNVSSLTITCTRGVDGSTATSHSVGAIVRHMATARDYQEPQTHMGATTGVHGAAGAVVGTTDTQALTNKTISGASNTLTNIPGANIVGSNAIPKSALPTDVDYINTIQTLTNKTLTSPVINTPTGIVKGDVGLGSVDNTSDVTKNAASVTLTNKAISGGANTITGIPNSALNTGIDAVKIASVASSFVAKSALPTDTQYRTDSGTLTSTSAVTPSIGWSDTGTTIRTVNGVTYLYIQFQRTGAALTAGAVNGDIVDTVMGLIVPVTYPASAALGVGRQGGTGLLMRVDSTGQIVVFQSIPGADINTGTTVVGSIMWM